MSKSPKTAKWNRRPPRYKREQEGQGVQSASSRRGWYIWRVPPEFAARTRPEHLRLDGQKFSWDDPPIINARTGARGHPGHDGNCRCLAEPVAE